jgi:hypothetical protein
MATSKHKAVAATAGSPGKAKSLGCTCTKKPAKCSPPSFGGCYNRRLPSGKYDFGNRVRNRSRSVSKKEKCSFDPKKSCGPYCNCSCNLRLKRAEKCKNLFFPIKESLRDATPVYDGLGNPRGILTPYICERGIKINFGQRKKMKIDGKVRNFVYGFDIRFMLSKEQIAFFGGKKKLEDAGWELKGAGSSWVPQAALKHTVQYMPTVVTKKPPTGSIGPYPVTGGDPNRYGKRKVVAKSVVTNERATDYLARPGYHAGEKFVNLLFNLPGHGGVSCDTIKADKSTHFYRSRAVKPVAIPLYRPGTALPPAKSPRKMSFVYGYVKTPSGKRYGWIAKDALGPRVVKKNP